MRVAKQVLAWERAPAGSHIDITLLAPAAMRRMNRRATGRRSLTDVIAYALPLPDGSILGDVYISPDAAGFERDELIRLAVHGTLHVLGYDHPEGAGRMRSRMWRVQERYVKKLVR